MNIWEVGDLGVPVDCRATNAFVFKVRSVGDTILEVSENAEFHGSKDAGDGYTMETYTVKKTQVRKI